MAHIQNTNGSLTVPMAISMAQELPWNRTLEILGFDYLVTHIQIKLALETARWEVTIDHCSDVSQCMWLCDQLCDCSLQYVCQLSCLSFYGSKMRQTVEIFEQLFFLSPICWYLCRDNNTQRFKKIPTQLKCLWFFNFTYSYKCL